MEKVPGVSAIEWKKIRKAARNACNRFAKDSKPVLLSEPPASAAASAATGKTAVPATAETIAEASVAATIPEHSKAAPLHANWQKVCHFILCEKDALRHQGFPFRRTGFFACFAFPYNRCE